MDYAGAAWGLSETSRTVLEHVVETLFRVPGVILLELWWIKRDLDMNEVTKQIIEQNPLPGYLDIMKITEFIHNRSLDHTAAIVLSYSGMFSLIILQSKVQ